MVFFCSGGIYVGLLKIRIVDKKAEEVEDRRQKVYSKKKKKGRSLQTKKRERERAQSDGEVSVERREWRERERARVYSTERGCTTGLVE